MCHARSQRGQASWRGHIYQDNEVWGVAFQLPEQVRVGAEWSLTAGWATAACHAGAALKVILKVLEDNFPASFSKAAVSNR